MKKSKIILIFIFIIAAAAVLYFAYGVVKQRYFGAGSGRTQSGETQNQAAGEEGSAQNPDQESPAPGEAAPGTESGRPNVTNADCDNDCAKYADNTDNFKYCREVCGQTKIAPKNSEEECAALSGLEKDYCFRDLAVSKKDPSICKKISDVKLQSVCRNRVAEEILN